MRRIITILSVFVFGILFLNSVSLAAGANVIGVAKDAMTGKPLWGANIYIMGTSLGAATDEDGAFTILNVPAGELTIKASYIGYETISKRIKIGEAKKYTLNFELKPVSVTGQEIVVTGQATGQSQAVNQQLSSDNIINVVSAAKIQELPDANAAESVGRLPGISVLRNGGEGTEVVIRGMAPKYNSVTVDGIKMTNANPTDRSTDLSMVSSNMLEGIQVAKSISADMDANVIGGTVNFELREAKTEKDGVPEYNLLMQGGYNNLSDVQNKLNNYKYVLSGENRFLDGLLGIFAQVDIERKNLTSNELGASYTHAGQSLTQYYTTGLNLYYIPRDIERKNAALVIDYKIPDGKIKFTNFGGIGSSNNYSRSETFDIADNQHVYALARYASQSHFITNGLYYTQQLPIFEVEAKVSHSYSDTKDPNDWAVNFLQNAAGLGKFNNVASVNPQDVPKAANNDLTSTYLNSIATAGSFSKERAVTASLDLKTTVDLADNIRAEIKFGGMDRYQSRTYNYDEYDGGGLQYGGAKYVNSLLISGLGLPSNIGYTIPISYFMDPKFNYGKFLNGDYTMNTPIAVNQMEQICNLLKNHVGDIAANNGSQAYGHDNLNSTTNNYSGHENQTAFYLMSTITIGQEITLIPGIRYQNLETSYTGIRGVESRNSFNVYSHYDTTATLNHGYWLPDVSLKYKPVDWFDLRVAYSNTLSYQDYNSVIPRIDLGNGAIAWNNVNLSPSRSQNFDVYVSFYDNNIGLFTVGGFLKRITNLIYQWNFYTSGSDVLQYLPYQLSQNYTPSGTYSVTTYVNDSYVVKDYGAEVDWQTHFWYLPGPLSGLVFDLNYTHIYSKAEYPFVNTVSTGRSLKYVDTSFTDRLIDQPNDIFNCSLGWDYHGFSCRASLIYTADIFTGVNYWPQLRTHTSAYRRWDISAKQELPWYNIQIFGDLNNVNGAYDVSVIQGGGVPASQQNYGMTADLGLRVKF